MKNLIFKKLSDRVERKDFNMVKVRKHDLVGMILNKADWERYRKAISPVALSHYKSRIMWFRGYPLKLKKEE